MLGDFLIKKDPRDLKPADFGVSPWSLPDRVEGAKQVDAASDDMDAVLEAALQLDAHWEEASKFVVHLGKRRFTDLQERPMDRSSMTSIAAAALAVLDPFIRTVVDSAPPVDLDQALPAEEDDEGWRQRALAERAAMLHDEYIQARDRLGLGRNSQWQPRPARPAPASFPREAPGTRQI